MAEEQTAQPNLAAMAESYKQMALAFAELHGTMRVFGYGYSLIVPTNAIHADAPPCSDAPLRDFQVTDTDQRTRVQLDVRKDNDAHVRGQSLFYGQIGYGSNMLDPERVKKDIMMSLKNSCL